MRCIAHDHIRVQFKTSQRLVDTLTADSVNVDRGQLAIGNFKQVRCLPTRRSAGIKNFQGNRRVKTPK